jgi:hypothetical protein
MSRNFFSWWCKNTLRTDGNCKPSHQMRPALESLEERVVMNASLLGDALLGLAIGLPVVEQSGHGDHDRLPHVPLSAGGRLGAGLDTSDVRAANAPSKVAVTLHTWVDPYSHTSGAQGGSAPQAGGQLGSSSNASSASPLTSGIDPSGPPVKITTQKLGAFSAMSVPWGSDQVQCDVVDPATQNVFFGMTSGTVWQFNEPTGTWTSWHTPSIVTSLAVAGPGLLAVGDGVGYGATGAYQINEATGQVTRAALSDGAVKDWQVLGTPGGVLAFDSWHGNVFQSTDGGLTYHMLACPGSQGVYTCFRAADGSLYMGGEGTWVTNGSAPLVSHDGGLTWQSAGVDNSNSFGNLTALGQANNGDILVGKWSLQGYPVQRISSSGVVTSSSSGLPAYTFARDFAAVGNNTVLVSLAKAHATEPPMVSFDDGHTWQSISSLPATANRGGFAVTGNYVYYFDAAGLYRAVK